MKLLKKAICVSFFDEMDSVCQKVLDDMGLDIPTITVSAGEDPDTALQRLITRIEKEASLVICRGVLATELRESLHISVLEIKRSYLDIFRALISYRGQNIRIGCLESPPFCARVREVAEVLGLEISYYEVRHVRDFAAGCQVLEGTDVDVLLGGSWGRLYPHLLHKPYISIDYTEESVRDCLEDMLHMFETLYQKEAQQDYLQLLLDHSSEGIFSVDRRGNLIQVNHEAERILGIDWSGKECIKVWDLFPQYAGEERLFSSGQDRDEVVSFRDQRLLLTRKPIIVEREVSGAVFFITEETRILEAERQMQLDAKARGFTAKHRFSDIKTRSTLMKDIITRAQLYSRMESTILLTGETGTGKEVFAQSIHNASSRADRPFVSVNCSAFTASLLESELFGYAEGAFTGAKRSGKAGVFEMAQGGTIFLDEIGEIDLSVQSRLLRVIQEKEIMRVGGDRVIPVNVRIIAATNRDLLKETAQGRFRLDLYYRLNVLELSLPPLRSRKEDIFPTAMDLIRRKNIALGCRVTGMDRATVRALENYDWPGNIRELSNIIERIVVITQSGDIHCGDISAALPQSTEKPLPAGFDAALTLAELERLCIIDRLEALDHNKSKTAQSLGIGQATLFRKIKQYGL